MSKRSSSLVLLAFAACTPASMDEAAAPGSADATTSHGSSGSGAAAAGGGAPSSSGSGATQPYDEDCSNVDVDESKSFIPQELAQLVATAGTVTQGSLTIDWVDYPLPYPDGKTWSSWGRGVVAESGKHYSTIGDHDSGGDSDGRDGNSFLYEYDPETRKLRAVGDALSAFGQHVAGDNGYGKVHGRVDEGPCGILYLHTYWGSATKVVYQGGYQGDLLLRYNPFTKHLESLGALMPQMGTPSTNLWRAGGLFYGEANTPDKDVAFWAYSIADGEVVYSGPKRPRFNRNIAIDAQGRAYTTDGGAGLYRYDPASHSEELLGVSFSNGGWLRASTKADAAGHITMVTQAPVGLYDFDPDGPSLTKLADGSDYIADIESDPTGKVAYYVPGAHGSSASFPLVEIDRATGAQRTIVSLADIVEGAGGTRPSGSYSINVSADGRTVFLAANGGTQSGFGQPVLVVVHLPEAELP
jgi:hypothetical protein